MLEEEQGIVSKDKTWLSLGEASQMLGVHTSTLRRWADQGQIPVYLTPGGHRRFTAADIRRFAETRRQIRPQAHLDQLWADQALTRTRQELTVYREQAWLRAFSESEREHKRAMGQRLLGLLLRFVSLDDEIEGQTMIIEEARAMGHEYATDAMEAELSLTQALEATMFFRDTLVEVAVQLPEIAVVRPETNTRLLHRITALLNVVQLAVVETYDQQRQQ